MTRLSPPPATHALGSELSLEHVFREHFDYVWRVSRTLVGPSLADDVAQEVFLLLRTRLGDFNGGSMRSWLYGLARNVARNMLRRRSRRERRERLVFIRPDVKASHGDAHEAADLMDRFLSRLPPPQREAFMLKVIEGLTAAEIGDAVGVPTQTVYSRLRAAKTQLASFRAEIEEESR